MTFSIKKLTIALFAGAVATVAFAAPANAASLSPYSTVTTSAALANSGVTAGNIVITTTPQTTGTADRIQIQLPTGWSATHGVAAGGVCADVVSSYVVATCNAFVGGGNTYVELTKGSAFAASTALTFTFPAGSLTQSTGRSFGLISVLGSNAGAIIDQGAATFPNTLSFDANGGTGSTAAIVTSSPTATLPANGFTRSGYTFAGWATNALGTGTIRQPGATYMISGDATIYAKWTVDPNATPSNSSSSSSSSSSTDLANTGIKTADAISFLIAGASLALVGAELMLIARRKRSN